jgi:hypothetical protein
LKRGIHKLRIKTARFWLVLLAAVLIVLNGLTLLAALPQIGGTQILCGTSGCTNAARDFSAYYEAGYRFLTNPSLVYSPGNVRLANGIVVTSQDFRYVPFFLPLFIVPLVIAFDYTHALIVFDLIQFALLPLIAYLFYKIMIMTSSKSGKIEKQNFVLFSATLVVSLLQPFVPSFADLTFWSWSYSRLWMEGEARVLQTVFLALTIFLVLKGSRFSGIPFVLSSFDPRMSILCLPIVLYLSITKKNLSNFALSSLSTLGMLYAPTMLDANLGAAFLGTIFIRDFLIYAYEWVPLLTVISLTGTLLILDSIPKLAMLNSDYALFGVLKTRVRDVLNLRPVSSAMSALSANVPSGYGDFRYLPMTQARYAI